jgi:serine/threonine protein kinase
LTLTPGARLGVYEVIARLGVGGMGEVYRARDEKLRRDVAIKVLPPLVTTDPERLTRFTREARLLAALNHPHIGAIHGLEDIAGTPALILELIEGDTLAERIARGPLPLADALSIATQIADAFEAAHEKGIVHRDLKPANIKITPEGVVKVLDFGVAKAMRSDGSRPEPSQTVTMVASTRDGTILGTAAYMSPEQARGQPVDTRTDIWAFGCVLFEMLAGRAAFEGGSIAEILGEVQKSEPDWRRLPADTPEAIGRLVRRCLRKDARTRLQHIGDARIEIAEAQSAPGTAETTRSSSHWSARRLAAVGASILALVVASIAIGYFLRVVSTPAPSSTLAPAKFAVSPPAGGSFAREPPTSFLALSPDGSQLAFVASDAGTDPFRIWLRPISGIEARPVPGTEGGRSPFWSPDSRFLGFFADGKLKRVDVRGGAALQIADVANSDRSHGTWGSAGTILIGWSDGGNIFSVPAGGGTLESIITPDRSNGEVRTVWPWFLPDGKRFVYLVRMLDGTGRVMVSERGGSPRTLLSAVSNVQWVDPDFLVFIQDGVLVGQRFDLATERLIGDPFSIAGPVDYHFTIARAMFTTSRNGLLAYHSHSDTSKLVWFDRAGHEVESVGQPGGYQSIRISPDGRSVLFDRMQPGSGSWDLWSSDLARDVETRLTADRGVEVTPAWLQDGRGIVFGADRGGPPHLFRRNLLTGVEDELRPAGRQQQAMDVSPDGGTLVYVERTARGNFDIFTLPLANPTAVSPLVSSSFDKFQVRYSPDGRIISYIANDTGAQAVYVASLSTPAAPLPVSRGLGLLPRWNRNGRELFYLSGNRVVAVPIQTTGPIVVGTASTLFTLPPSTGWQDFDVSVDGKRFLAVIPQVRPGELPVTVVLNWTIEVQRRQ